LVDRERAVERLARLHDLLARLEAIHAAGEAAYLADLSLRLQAERALQLGLQICIDLAAQLVAEQGLRMPSSYAELFGVLASEGVLADGLAERLAAAARQRNLLVHEYLRLDDRLVFASLARLDDLRAFAAFVERMTD
jgi:uncharacterized protein YutE (UPF0331/DUF86 family)